MPKPPQKQEVQGRYFRWLLGQRNGVYFADGRSNQPSLGRQSLGTRNKSEALLAIEQLDLTMAVQRGLADSKLLKTNHEKILTWAEGRALYESFVKRPRVAGGPRASTTKRYRPVFDKFIKFAESQGQRT